jgi:serine/threonine protein kinase
MLPRETIGPYQLLERLGAGGMAEVYLARVNGASGFSKLVALKMLLPGLQDDGRLQKLLITEAKLAARLSHRNLVAVHDFGMSDGRYYMRMDYIDGCDLARAHQKAPLPPPLTLLIAEEVASALAYLHRVRDEAGRPLGLVHRDVNPTNVLLSKAGDVKLTDYGVIKATALASFTAANALKGKYAYMSPEQVKGAAIDARSDQFSLGVMLYEMLAGRRPFDATHHVELLEQIRSAEIKPLKGVDRAIRKLVNRLLERDPKARYADCHRVADEIARVRHRRALRIDGGPAAHRHLADWLNERLARLAQTDAAKDTEVAASQSRHTVASTTHAETSSEAVEPDTADGNAAAADN